MIGALQIKKFVDRPRDDFRSWKQLSPFELEAMVAELPTKPPIWKKLSQTQKVCFQIGVRIGSFFFILDTGKGKSLLAMALSLYYRKLRMARRWLVLVPNRVNVDEWRDEFEKHIPGIPYILLKGSSVDKWDALESHPDPAFVVVTYDGLVRMLSNAIEDKKRSTKRKKKQKLKLDPKLLRRFAALVDGLHLDESTEIANKMRLPFRMVRQLAKLQTKAQREAMGEPKLVYTLTGTPFGRDPKPVWAQMYLVDGGASLGETLGLFRSAFYKEVFDDFGRAKHHFDKSKEKLLNRFLCHRSIRYKVDPKTLPKVIPKKVYFRLAADPQRYLDQAMKALRQARGNFQQLKTSFMRMRQIASGFLGYKDDDSGAKAQIEFNPNVKLDGLMRIMQEEIREGDKSIIFHEFIYSGFMIARELERAGIDFARIYGGTKDTSHQLGRFKTDPSCGVLILNNAAGAFGLNLQVAKNGLYFESPVDPKIRLQTQRRFERQFSAHSEVGLWDLLTRGTPDETILRFHAEGRNLWKAVVDGEFRF